jgi:catechol 2,3-dioxygenase-like lactoylglutathione lyase family enzyme
MLGDSDAIATIGVKDMKAAGTFYGETLGLKRGAGDELGVLTFESGNSKIFVYESQYAGTNQATAATWVLDDVENVVKALAAKGVKFEHYDLPGLTLQGDIHVAESMKAAWFKDPDGNILALVSR